MTYKLSATDKQIQDLGRNLFKGAWQYFCTVIFLTLLVVLAVSWLFGGFDRDDTDSNTSRSGMKLRTDYGTGCQYLETADGGITPRMDSAGKQVCRWSARKEADNGKG